MGFQMDDYVDVAQRIADFREKYPDGRLRQHDVQFLEFAGKTWVVYTADALRSEDDQNPAQGTAWEPVPGATNFTRDSELQNAETAAWGRAIVAALASDTKNGVASRQEVRNRQAQDAAAAREQQREALVPKIAAAKTVEECRALWQACSAVGLTDEIKARVAEIEAGDGGE